MDFDVSIVNPVLISLNENRVVEFFESEACGAWGFLTSIHKLDLLVLRICTLGSCITYVFEDLSKFFLTEFQAHHSTLMQEVKFHHELIVWRIKLFVCFLHGVAFLLELLAEFVDQIISIV